MTDVILNFSADIAEIRLTRNSKRNALSLDMIKEIIQHQSKIKSSNARGILICADGPVFCAGHDFAEMAGASDKQMHDLFCACTEMMQNFHFMPQPILAAVQGPAIGAGCQLALAADLIVAGQSAIFQTPGGKGAWFCTTPMVEVQRALAPKQALEMLFIGEPIDAVTALSWGMINRVVEDANLYTAAKDLLNLASRGSAASKSSGKKTYYQIASLDLKDAYAISTEVMAKMGAEEEAQNAMKDIVAKKRVAL